MSDFNKDGIVSPHEIDLEMKLEKAEQQAFIAKVALFSMVAVVIYLISPWGPSVETLAALDATLSTYFIAMASVVGAFMGFTAWMSRDRMTASGSTLRRTSYNAPPEPDVHYAVYRTDEDQVPRQQQRTYRDEPQDT